MVWNYVFLHKQYNYQPGVPLLSADDPVQTGTETNRFIIYILIIEVLLVGHHQVTFVVSVKSRADSMLASSHWETLLQSNTVSHWLGTNLELALQSLASSVKFMQFISTKA